MNVNEPATSTGLRHTALFYRTDAEYLAAVSAFVAGGLDTGQPVFVAVPGGRIGPLRDVLGQRAGQVAFADMTEMGRNPAWIIPRVRQFVDGSGGREVRYVGEPIWAGRSPAELREAARHESLLNLAFRRSAASIVCPYDIGRLSGPVLADAERTHPVLARAGVTTPSARYGGAGVMPPDAGGPLPPAPAGADSLTYRSDLSQVRALAERHAREAGLPGDRAAYLVLAVSELAANTMRHTGREGTVRAWHDQQEVVCEVADRGHITDPLAGRFPAPPGSLDGHGLWIVHQACDLVELRSGPDGTTVRVHMSRPVTQPGPRPGPGSKAAALPRPRNGTG